MRSNFLVCTVSFTCHLSSWQHHLSVPDQLKPQSYLTWCWFICYIFFCFITFVLNTTLHDVTKAFCLHFQLVFYSGNIHTNTFQSMGYKQTMKTVQVLGWGCCTNKLNMICNGKKLLEIDWRRIRSPIANTWEYWWNVHIHTL